MATHVMVNITVSTAEELDRVLRILRGEAPLGEPAEGNTLEEAIEIAQSYIDAFQPFTYDDVGLPVSRKEERKSFRAWISGRDILFWQGNIAGSKGFRGMSFRPFRIDESGNKIFARYPEETESL